MFIIVENNSVVLSSNLWNKKKFQTFLQEEYELTVDIPAIPVEFLEINENIKLYLAQWELLPTINTRTEIMHGPFWTFNGTTATGSYQPLTKNIDTIKSEMLGDIADQRWRKETEGVVLTLQNKLIWATTQRQERDIFLQAVQLGSNGATWKLTEVEQVEVSELYPTGYKIKDTAWLVLSLTELQQIVASIVTKVQSAFDWESNLTMQIKASTTVEELAAIKY